MTIFDTGDTGSPPAPDQPYIIKRGALNAPSEHNAFIFAAPHSGRHYPAQFVEQTDLSAHHLRKSEDAWVDKLFGSVAQSGGTQLIATYGRSYVDLNRSANELDPGMFAPPLPAHEVRESHRVRAGLGVIPKMVAPGEDIYQSRLPAREAKFRLNQVYHAYHDTLRSLIDARRARYGRAILIDCHSMPSNTDQAEAETTNGHSRGKSPARTVGTGAARILGSFNRRNNRNRGADIVLGDLWGVSCDSFLTSTAERLLVSAGFNVVRNIPYAGGFATQHYGKPKAGVHALQIEINRALYMDEQTLEPSPQFKTVQRKLSRFAVALMSEFGRLGALAAE